MWYLHIHLVCDKLFDLFAIKITFPFIYNFGLNNLIINGKVIFLYNIHRAPA